MKNKQLEMERGHLDGYIYDIRSFIDNLIREIEDLEFDIDRKDDEINRLQNTIDLLTKSTHEEN